MNIDSNDGESRSHDPRSTKVLFSEIRRIAKEGVDEVEHFKESWQNESIEKLWERTKNMESFEGGQGDDVWTVDYIGIVGKEEPQNVEIRQDLDQTMDVSEEDEQEDVTQIVTAVQEQHPGSRIVVETEGEEAKLNIRVAGMRFNAKRQGKTWEICSDGTSSDIQKSIMKQVNARKSKSSLKYLLVRTFDQEVLHLTNPQTRR